MRSLFGNPDDGTVLAWLADGGLFAIIIIVGSIIGWLVARRITRRSRDRLIDFTDDIIERVHLEFSLAAHRRLFIFFTDLLIGGVIIGTAAALGSLSVLGVDVEPALAALADIGRALQNWWADNGVQITIIIVLAVLVSKILERSIPRFMRAFVQRVSATTVDASESAKRTETLTGVAKGASKVMITIVAGMMVLSELSVPIAPILGGFGIAGIAVGFGAQWLIRDLINGIFILAENQYRQGDVVTVAGTTGRVESINLRRTTLRDLDGKVHVIPNGEITVASNFTKHWSNIHMDIGVAYKEDMQHVFDVLNDIGDSMASDPYFGEMIIETPKVLRLNSFDDSAITIKMLGVCKPLTQWEIKGEMNRRIKKRFDEEGIEIPFPHQTVYWGYGAHPARGNQGTEWVEPGKKEIAVAEPDPEGTPPGFQSFGLAAGMTPARPSRLSSDGGRSHNGITEEEAQSARDLKKVAPQEDFEGE